MLSRSNTPSFSARSFCELAAAFIISVWSFELHPIPSSRPSYHYLTLATAQLGKSLILDLVCDPPGDFGRGRLLVWSWSFHLSKFYELFDTFFLALGKSNIRFLHTYHHVLTLLATYYGLHTRITLQWVGLVTNTFVHIWMYFSFCVNAFGLRLNLVSCEFHRINGD